MHDTVHYYRYYFLSFHCSTAPEEYSQITGQNQEKGTDLKLFKLSVGSFSHTAINACSRLSIS